MTMLKSTQITVADDVCYNYYLKLAIPQVTASGGGYAYTVRVPLTAAAFAECMRKRLRSAGGTRETRQRSAELCSAWELNC